ncbi:GTP pyrophosphokinase [Filifactor villosus]|uniref:GTP pyrophosphokinase family protein n=1 Tax=Filifactor villosus TaxID=29374 RepID=A0ABV9QJ14_9FIRM
MELRDWKKTLLPYECAVEELKVKFKNVRKELRSNGEYSPIEFVTGRVKRVTSILEKVKRLDIDIGQLEEEMEDIAGIRIMCQLVDDIYIIARHIQEREDMEVVYVKDYIENHKESGYRSYHIIIRYPIQTIYGHKKILAEIQIRTLAMNFWATIEHSLNYKYDKYVPQEIQDRLSRAADAAALLDKEMSVIREEIVSAQVAFEYKSIVVKEIAFYIKKIEELGYKKEAVFFQNLLDENNEERETDELLNLRRDVATFYDSTKKPT